MERLTDRKTAADLKSNTESLRELGFEPTILDQRYIKLAEYEDIEELFLNLSPHLEKWQVIHIRYAMLQYIGDLKAENKALKDFIKMVLGDIEKYLPEIKGEYKSYRGIDIQDLLKDGD
jgi:hypothetical protein